ncbi:MAG: hypothetical protein AB1552_11800 [Nitrospirota bacterium]
MAELPTLDMSVVTTIKKLMDNIRNDIDAGNSMDDIADLVHDHRLTQKKAYKKLLQSICDLLREKGYPSTADFFAKLWHL